MEVRENAMLYALCAMHMLAGPGTLKQLTYSIFLVYPGMQCRYDPGTRHTGTGKPQLAPLGPVSPAFLHLPRTAVSGSRVILTNLGFSYFFLWFFAICISPEKAYLRGLYIQSLAFSMPQLHINCYFRCLSPAPLPFAQGRSSSQSTHMKSEVK